MTRAELPFFCFCTVHVNESSKSHYINLIEKRTEHIYQNCNSDSITVMDDIIVIH